MGACNFHVRALSFLCVTYNWKVYACACAQKVLFYLRSRVLYVGSVQTINLGLYLICKVVSTICIHAMFRRLRPFTPHQCRFVHVQIRDDSIYNHKITHTYIYILYTWLCIHDFLSMRRICFWTIFLFFYFHACGELANIKLFVICLQSLHALYF